MSFVTKLSKLVPTMLTHVSCRALSTTHNIDLTTPSNLFNAAVDETIDALRKTTNIPDPRIKMLLTTEEIDAARESTFAAAAFGAPVAKDFAKAGLGLPPISGAPYAYMNVGIQRYVRELSNQKMGTVAYPQYRVPPIMAGAIPTETIQEFYMLMANSFFSQFEGATHPDFNTFFRSIYPTGFHPKMEINVDVTGNNLGRAIEAAAAQALAEQLAISKGYCPHSQAMFRALITGDSQARSKSIGPMVSSLSELARRNLPAFGGWFVQSNGAMISSQTAETPEAAAWKHIQDLQQQTGGLITVLKAPVNIAYVFDTLSAVRTVSKQSFETGRFGAAVTYGLPRFGGHASDKPQMSQAELEKQVHDYAKQVSAILMQLSVDGVSGPEMADRLEHRQALAEESVQCILKQPIRMDSARLISLSQPGPLTPPAGRDIQFPIAYFTQQPSGPAKLGATIFDDAMLKIAKGIEADGGVTIIISQENTAPASRVSVYGELQQTASRHGDAGAEPKGFIQLGVNEQLQVHLAAQLRVVLERNLEKGSKKVVIFVRLPHHDFVADHAAADASYYGGINQLETGENSATICIYDGFSLAQFDSERGYWHAKVGYNHNNPNLGAFMASPNNIVYAPMDMRMFQSLLPDAVEQNTTHSRQVFFPAPTKAFAAQHHDIELPEKMGIHDVVSVTTDGNAPRNGKKLVIVTYGPDAAGIISHLQSLSIAADVKVVPSNQTPNALRSYFLKGIKTGDNFDVIYMGQDPGNFFLSEMKTKIDSDCQTLADQLAHGGSYRSSGLAPEAAFSAYGNGESLQHPSDLSAMLRARGLLQDPTTISAPASATKVRASIRVAQEIGEARLIKAGEAAEFKVEIDNPDKTERVSVSFAVEAGSDV